MAKFKSSKTDGADVFDEEGDAIPEGLASQLVDDVDTAPKKMKITLGEVTKMLGVSRQTVIRYVDRNLLVPCEKNSAGVRFFWTTDVEAFKNTGLIDDTPEQEAANVAANAMVSLVKEGLLHARQSAQLYFGPAQIANSQLERIIERQANRILELEKQQNDSHSLFLELQDKKHERELELAEVQAKANNRRYMMQEALKTLPIISTAIAEKFGLSQTSVKLMQFLNVLDREKLQALMSPELGILDETERGALTAVLTSAGIELPTPEAESSTPTAETTA